LLGTTTGSFGETCGLLILIGGIYLILRRSIDWRVPVAILGTVIIFTGILFMIDSTRYPDPLFTVYPDPLFTVFSGGLLLGAFFMATDPVTSPLTPKGTWIFGIGIGIIVILIRVFSPLTPKGTWIFGIGIGIIVILIRVFGGFPEGMMYAILLMNAIPNHALLDTEEQPNENESNQICQKK